MGKKTLGYRIHTAKIYLRGNEDFTVIRYRTHKPMSLQKAKKLAEQEMAQIVKLGLKDRKEQLRFIFDSLSQELTCWNELRKQYSEKALKLIKELSFTLEKENEAEAHILTLKATQQAYTYTLAELMEQIANKSKEIKPKTKAK